VYGFSHLSVNTKQMTLRHLDPNGMSLHAFTKTPEGASNSSRKRFIYSNVAGSAVLFGINSSTGQAGFPRRTPMFLETR
jgi:hypothetical protein